MKVPRLEVIRATVASHSNAKSDVIRSELYLQTLLQLMARLDL